MIEKKAWALGALEAIAVLLVSAIGIVVGFSQQIVWLAIAAPIVLLLALISLAVVQPNQAVVITLFGRYLGTLRNNGLWLTIPFTIRKKVSLRVRNFNSVKLKVNDVDGNPIEIAAVVVFRVIDPAKALFDVDHYEQFVEIQSETALRHVASKYPYDCFTGHGMSLRANTEEVARELANELQDRLMLAGVEVLEARLTHLAYSTEIASSMLQRQQASAILSARQIIVEGAVTMVQMAIAQLEAQGLELDPERKAAMINNLLVAVVSDRAAHPVINTGSLY